MNHDELLDKYPDKIKESDLKCVVCGEWLGNCNHENELIDKLWEERLKLFFTPISLYAVYKIYPGLFKFLMRTFTFYDAIELLLPDYLIIGVLGVAFMYRVYKWFELETKCKVL